LWLWLWSWSEGAESASGCGRPSMLSWAAPWSLSPSWSWSPEREGLFHQPGLVLWRTHRGDPPNVARIWRNRSMSMSMLRKWTATNNDRLRSPVPPPRPLRPGPRPPLSRPFSAGSSFSCASLSGDGNRSSIGTAIGPNGGHGRCVVPAEIWTLCARSRPQRPPSSPGNPQSSRGAQLVLATTESGGDLGFVALHVPLRIWHRR
jgi:hypothetical protein